MIDATSAREGTIGSWWLNSVAESQTDGALQQRVSVAITEIRKLPLEQQNDEATSLIAAIRRAPNLQANPLVESTVKFVESSFPNIASEVEQRPQPKVTPAPAEPSVTPLSFDPIEPETPRPIPTPTSTQTPQ